MRRMENKKKYKFRCVFLGVCIAMALVGCKSNIASNNALAYQGVYTLDEAPYSNAGKIKKALRELDNLEDAVYIDIDYGKEINIRKELKESTSSSRYLYAGKTQKGRPDGLGVLLAKSELQTETIDMIGTKGPLFYQIVYVGEFDNGRLDGYGCLFTQDQFPCMIYDGNFKKGEYSGTGRVYAEDAFSELSDNNLKRLPEGIMEAERMIESGEGGRYISPVLLTVGKLEYEGEFKSGEYNGNGDLFIGTHLSYSGEWKTGRRSGKGIEYFTSGQEDGTMKIKYEGEFKSNKYHGKGILYNEDGSIKYKGKFKNGDIK